MDFSTFAMKTIKFPPFTLIFTSFDFRDIILLHHISKEVLFMKMKLVRSYATIVEQRRKKPTNVSHDKSIKESLDMMVGVCIACQTHKLDTIEDIDAEIEIVTILKDNADSLAKIFYYNNELDDLYMIRTVMTAKVPPRPSTGNEKDFSL